MLKERKYIVIVLLIIISILFFILSLIITDNRKLTCIEKTIKDTTLSINNVINIPINYTKKEIKKYNDRNKIYNKYDKLLKEYNKIKMIKKENEELSYQINELKKVSNLNKTLNETSYINSTVISRNIGYWYNKLIIDVGEKKGIKKDMAVITNDGLIGKVIKTTKKNSTVKLLTTEDTNNKISIKIKVDEEKYVYGLLSGYDKKNKKFIVEGIADNTEIKKGSVVTTTGLGNDFPSGILIGNVDSITKDNFDLSKTVLVSSSVNFDNINYVTVLIKGEKK